MNAYRPTSHHHQQTRGIGYPQGGIPQGYPGLSEAPPSGYMQPAPFGGGSVSAPDGGAKKGLLGGLNMNELSNLINRMGGIDGIVATMGKVQKLVSGFQQMAPMIKLLASTLLPGAKTADNDDEDGVPRRRRRRARRGAAARRKGSGRRRRR